MKIQQTSCYQSIDLLNAAERHTVLKSMKDVQKHLLMTDAIDVEISEEGFKALREKVKEFEPELDYIDFDKVKPVETNEVEFEHYMTMMQMSGLILEEKGNYNVVDVMNTIMETYETLYNQIVEEHKYGDRQVSYDVSGDRSLTLEEDLAGLDKAFEMRMQNLKGYIACQQTNKAFAHPDYDYWFMRKNGILSLQSAQSKRKAIKKDDYNYMDEDYIDTAVAMMNLARENFLVLLDSKDYQKGDGRYIISDIINKNDDFIAKTHKLFS